MVVVDPHVVRRLEHLDHLVGELLVHPAVRPPHLLREAAVLDHVVQRRPQEGAAEPKVEGALHLGLEEDGDRVELLELLGERLALVLLGGDPRAADPHDALPRGERLRLLRRHRVVVPLDRPAAALGALDRQRQDVRDDEDRAAHRRRELRRRRRRGARHRRRRRRLGVHVVVVAGRLLGRVLDGRERRCPRSCARDMHRRERRRRRRRRPRRGQHVHHVAARRLVVALRHDDPVAVERLPAVEAAAAEDDVLVLDGRARRHRDGRARPPQRLAALGAHELHRVDRVPAAERAVLADDVDDLVLVRRAVLQLEVEERERGGGARRPGVRLAHRAWGALRIAERLPASTARRWRARRSRSPPCTSRLRFARVSA